MTNRRLCRTSRAGARAAETSGPPAEYCSRQKSSHRSALVALGDRNSREVRPMRVRLLWLPALAVLLAGRPAAGAEAPDGAAALARQIDRLIERRWAELGVQPAAPAD